MVPKNLFKQITLKKLMIGEWYDSR